MNESEATGLFSVGAEEACRQLDHVLKSEKFRKAPGLSHHLRYLITKIRSGPKDRHLRGSGYSGDMGGLPPYFQSVIRTEIIKGQASTSSLAAARVVEVGKKSAVTASSK